jgi:hypothetical protein
MTKNCKKTTAGRKLNIFGSKTTIHLFLSLHKGRPSYRKSLQPSKENIQHFKTRSSSKFLFLWAIFALLDPDPESVSGSTDPLT